MSHIGLFLTPDLAYKLYLINFRPLPGADDEPTGLIQDTRFRPGYLRQLTILRGFLTV